MKILTNKFIAVAIVSVSMLFAYSCEVVEEEVPTKSRMEGTWVVTEAYNDKDSSILDKIAFPVTAFNLASDHSVVSTAGPMFMYIVYGDSKYTTIAAKIDQVFNYASLNFNSGGEWFIDGGVVDKFTLEMKLEGLPGQKALTVLLDMLGIGSDYLDVVVYHKFMDVSVNLVDDQTMIWTFTQNTKAVYNSKDKYGNYVLWNGWPVNNFSHSTFVLKKNGKSLKEIVQNAKK